SLRPIQLDIHRARCVLQRVADELAVDQFGGEEITLDRAASVQDRQVFGAKFLFTKRVRGIERPHRGMVAEAHSERIAHRRQKRRSPLLVENCRVMRVQNTHPKPSMQRGLSKSIRIAIWQRCSSKPERNRSESSSTTYQAKIQCVHRN